MEVIRSSIRTCTTCSRTDMMGSLASSFDLSNTSSFDTSKVRVPRRRQLGQRSQDHPFSTEPMDSGFRSLPTSSEPTIQQLLEKLQVMEKIMPTVTTLTKKVEELTSKTNEQNREITQQKLQNKKQQKEINRLTNKSKQLDNKIATLHSNTTAEKKPEKPSTLKRSKSIESLNDCSSDENQTDENEEDETLNACLDDPIEISDMSQLDGFEKLVQKVNEEVATEKDHFSHLCVQLDMIQQLVKKNKASSVQLTMEMQSKMEQLAEAVGKNKEDGNQFTADINNLKKLLQEKQDAMEKTIKNQMELLVEDCKQTQSGNTLVATQGKQIHQLTKEQANIKKFLEKKEGEMDRRMKILMDQFGFLQQVEPSPNFDDQMKAVQKNSNDITYLKEEVKKLRFPIGAFTWKIEHFPRKFNNLKQGRYLESQPFYSKPNGYKLCLMLHNYGDSLSVVLCLLNDQNDDHLKWPMICKFTVFVIDQMHRVDHLIKCFSSHPKERVGDSKHEGINRFDIPLLQLLGEKYMSNDTIQLRVIINN